MRVTKFGGAEVLIKGSLNVRDGRDKWRTMDSIEDACILLACFLNGTFRPTGNGDVYPISEPVIQTSTTTATTSHTWQVTSLERKNKKL